MTRINIYTHDSISGERALEGYFDRDKATEYREATRWDGNNNISVTTGSQWEHQALYRTAGGRWVLRNWSQWQGTEETYQFVTPERAQEWLLINDEDAAVAEHFGEVEEERGPGRPEVGKASSVRLGDDLTGLADARAEQEGIARAELIRKAVRQYVEA